VKDVEDKLDGLIALISSHKQAATSATNQHLDPLKLAAGGPSTQTSSSPDSTEDVPHSSSSRSACAAYPARLELLDSPDAATTSSPDNSTSHNGNSAARHDVVARGIVSETQARLCLQAYACDAAQLPFVLLPPHSALDALRRERPCWLLAALVITTEPPLQDRLVYEFRRMLAQALLVDVRRSLDLLQGLIVFCAWSVFLCRALCSLGAIR